MDAYVFFENHDEKMIDLPIIFHKNIICTSPKFNLINWHENIEILRIINGEGVILCGEKSIIVKRDDVIIINANKPHGFIGKDSMEYNCLIIDRKYALKNGIDTSKIFFDEHIQSDNITLNLFDNIYSIMKDSPELIDIGATVLPLLCYLYHNFSNEINPTKKHDDETVKNAINYMLSNFNSELSLDSIAEIVGISKYHFIRKFKKITGYTPMQYLNMQRCEIAKSLLNESYTVKQVSELTGFYNSSYFSKVFQSVTGKLPSEYKQ